MLYRSMENITQQVEHYFLLAEQHFKQVFVRPALSLKLAGKTAGMAHITDNRLRFNEAIYRQQPAAFLAETIPHEVAHLVAYARFGLRIKPHGKEWQYVMQQVFAVPAKRTHEFVIPSETKRRTRRYEYQCQCDAASRLHYLSAQRQALIARKKYRYRCQQCQAQLQYTGRNGYFNAAERSF